MKYPRKRLCKLTCFWNSTHKILMKNSNEQKSNDDDYISHISHWKNCAIFFFKNCLVLLRSTCKPFSQNRITMACKKETIPHSTVLNTSFVFRWKKICADEPLKKRVYLATSIFQHANDVKFLIHFVLEWYFEYRFISLLTSSYM